MPVNSYTELISESMAQLHLMFRLPVIVVDSAGCLVDYKERWVDTEKKRLYDTLGELLLKYREAEVKSIIATHDALDALKGDK